MQGHILEAVEMTGICTSKETTAQGQPTGPQQ
jgi:hypothetical protein